ncbi:LysR family transcriptional regulator [Ectopseudomonas mendocina]|jgi:DNA-binding transcriptional LysR family regulator|uniref:LysR family transcriptional regulator n=1 Tax=Ectopseudomonas mendocina TaxID=300 RepID=A0ABD7RP62_ECTME|nr:LysR substrate-binding domain-containing protein [Pseudomonas mendocina]TRO10406.1 LysR family transcriptional regulator [Pseudomonas mendocina]TRO12282.1 LysR family transcriptional regulator [Pseudomonas mendocina]
MEVNWLEDFLTLAVTRNFSRAAEMRNVTQPAFSRRIQILEAWAGASLIDRSMFPITLTPAGEAFRRTAQEILETLRHGREEMQGLVPAGGEVITISASHTLAVSFFADWHAELQQSVGRVNARVLADNVAACAEALIAGTCDLMLAYSDSGVANIIGLDRYPSVLLASDRLVPVSGPGPTGDALYSFSGKQRIPYLCYPSNSFLGRMTRSVVERESLANSLEYRFECSMADVLKRGVIAGVGVAWVPERVVRDELASGALVLAGDDRHTISLGITLYRKAEISSPQVEKIWTRALEQSALGEG